MSSEASFARRSLRHLASRLTMGVVAFVLVGAAACVQPRDIRDPVDGAVVVTFPDSARLIFDATVAALNDEPIRISLTDRARGVIETDYIDLTSVRLSVNMAEEPMADRMVKFRFRTRTTLGATHLVAEAIRRPLSGGAAMERMLPPAHPAHQVLRRILGGVDERLASQRSR